MDSGDQKKKKKGANLIRISSGLACNGEELIREKVQEEDEFVYDLYYLNDNTKSDAAKTCGGGISEYIDRLLNVRAYGDESMFDYRQGGCDDDDDDSEDSNAEDHWANDYPEEEDGSERSDNDEDDLEDLMDRMGLDGSDEEYGGDDDDDDDGGLIRSMAYDRDEEMHGAAYARFKKRFLKRQGGGGDDSDDEDLDDEDDDDADELY